MMSHLAWLTVILLSSQLQRGIIIAHFFMLFKNNPVCVNNRLNKFLNLSDTSKVYCTTPTFAMMCSVFVIC